MRKPIRFISAAAASFTLAASAVAGDPSRGLFLAEKRTCIECHSVTVKNVGPSFSAIAARYRHQPGAREMLVDKIRYGGTQHWGERFNMWPQTIVPDDELYDLVDWILQQ
jgi:cytochrome c